MNQHVSNTVLARKKATLWTPWGAQRVPEQDKTPNLPIGERREVRAAPDWQPEFVEPLRR